MIRCSACRGNFTEQSKREYKDAPAWNQECPKCVKKKFEKYLVEYVMVLMDAGDLAVILNDFFKGVSTSFSAADGDDTIKRKITKLVYDINSLQGRPDLAKKTTGQRIKELVNRIDRSPRLKRPGVKNPQMRRSALIVILIAALMISLGMVLLYT